MEDNSYLGWQTSESAVRPRAGTPGPSPEGGSATSGSGSSGGGGGGPPSGSAYGSDRRSGPGSGRPSGSTSGSADGTGRRCGPGNTSGGQWGSDQRGSSFVVISDSVVVDDRRSQRCSQTRHPWRGRW